MTKIEWINNSQTLLRIDNRIINLGAGTQIILDEYLEDGEMPHVTFYFGVPIGNSLHDNNVPVDAELDSSNWWVTYRGEKAEKLREFFSN